MANHAYVYATKEEITPERVEALIKEFHKKTLHGFLKFERQTPGRCSDIEWFLSFDDYNAVYCWIRKEFKVDDEDVPCMAVEFRHGHSSAFMWWADVALENWLALHLRGKIIDEGTWTPMRSKFSKYMTYDGYIKYRIGKSQRALKRKDTGEKSHYELARENDEVYLAFLGHMNKKGDKNELG